MTNVCWNTKPGNGPSQLLVHSVPLTPIMQLPHGKREKEKRGHWCFKNTVRWVRISGQLTEMEREFSLLVLPGFQHHHGEKPLKELLEMLPANEPCRDSPGTLGMAGTPQAPQQQRVPQLGLLGSRWCTAGSGYTSQTDSYITGNVKEPS